MDKFIKIVPVIVGMCLLAFVLQIDDSEYTNTTAAMLCASVVVLLTAVVYIIMDYFEHSLMPAGRYLVVMFGSGFVTFAVLYASLEYFYS
jgi:putative effector of murein hydrolase LrgA (UPF0299 family)